LCHSLVLQQSQQQKGFQNVEPCCHLCNLLKVLSIAICFENISQKPAFSRGEKAVANFAVKIDANFIS
jgi:hypothetical protein